MMTSGESRALRSVFEVKISGGRLEEETKTKVDRFGERRLGKKETERGRHI